MTKKHNNDKNSSKNYLNCLTEAVLCLKRGEGITVAQENGKKIALYPAELLSEEEQKKYELTKNQTFITLAKRAGLLPALAVIHQVKITENWSVFSESELKKAIGLSGGEIFETARAKLPLKNAEDSLIVTFRLQGDEASHLALIIGDTTQNKIPLIRVHSSCVTGDLLGSLRCDCGDQLKLALNLIKESGYGILLYLNQEGRGIGITNKIRAYELQDQGMDTYEANNALGFADDERDFSIAAYILKSLGISKIRLLSNNPHKVTQLRKYGIAISKREPLIAKAGRYNKAYIAAKAKKAGHVFD